MSARKFFADLFGNKNQIEITTQIDEQSDNRRLSVSNSGRFRQKNKNRVEIQKDTFRSPSSEPAEANPEDKPDSEPDEKRPDKLKRQESEI